ncbi:MAG: hypothetical protein CR972_00985 [Candidatus Moraniibacteriota bacterium]|nr:MAG: hypothetical protein CR972_00985 [Candidatus Moranbacteria bacterium]
MKKYCYFNGKIIEEKNIHISPHDLGILRGYSVFDFMHTTHNKPFRLNDHWTRLKNSAKELNLKLPINKKEYQEILDTLIKKNTFIDPSIRTVLTAGISEDGLTIPKQSTFYILIQDKKLFSFPKNLYKKGGKIITTQFARLYPESKTTSYIESMKNQKKRIKKGAHEILYINGTTVLECTMSNIFIIKNGTVITPKDDILHGITRKVVLELLAKNNIPHKERKITQKQLLCANEIFITGSAKHILPIVKIDKEIIEDGKVGTLTKEINTLYLNYLNSY